MSQLIHPSQPIIDIRDYAYIPTASQYQIYREMIGSIGRAYYKTQRKLQEYYSRKTKLAAGDTGVVELDNKIERLTRHLGEYGRYNRILGDLMNLEDELVAIIQPVRMYCEAHMTPYYMLTDTKRYVELQNKYKEYMVICNYIESKRKCRG